MIHDCHYDPHYDNYFLTGIHDLPSPILNEDGYAHFSDVYGIPPTEDGIPSNTEKKKRKLYLSMQRSNM